MMSKDCSPNSYSVLAAVRHMGSFVCYLFFNLSARLVLLYYRGLQSDMMNMWRSLFRY